MFESLKQELRHSLLYGSAAALIATKQISIKLTIPDDLFSGWLISFKTSVHRYIILYVQF